MYTCTVVTEYGYHFLLESGRKAFIQADGIKVLYTSALETLECKTCTILLYSVPEQTTGVA